MHNYVIHRKYDIHELSVPLTEMFPGGIYDQLGFVLINNYMLLRALWYINIYRNFPDKGTKTHRGHVTSLGPWS